MRARGLSANRPQAKASKSTLKSPTYAHHSAEPKKEPRKQKTKDPQTQTTKRPAGLLPRNLPNLPNLPHVCDWWLKMQKQNVCLFASFVLDMTANMPHCKIKCKTSQTECSHNHKSKPKNNHVASSAFMAAFKIPLAKVVLYLAVSDQFTSFMTACEATHLHCPKFWFMIITNGRELEVNPKLLPTAFPEAVRKPVAHKCTCTSNKCPAFLSVSLVKTQFQISFLHGSSNELQSPSFK